MEKKKTEFIKSKNGKKKRKKEIAKNKNGI